MFFLKLSRSFKSLFLLVNVSSSSYRHYNYLWLLLILYLRARSPNRAWFLAVWCNSRSSVLGSTGHWSYCKLLKAKLAVSLFHSPLMQSSYLYYSCVNLEEYKYLHFSKVAVFIAILIFIWGLLTRWILVLRSLWSTPPV